jgi:hypothetical protein
MFGVPQPSEHFECTLQDCGSGQELQSAPWGTQHFSPSPWPSGGEASEGAAGLDRILQAALQHLAKTFPAKSSSIVQGHTELLDVWRPATFGTSRLRQRAEAAKCGMGCNTFVSEPQAKRVVAGGLDCILQAELHHLASTFHQKRISIVLGHTELLNL